MYKKSVYLLLAFAFAFASCGSKTESGNGEVAKDDDTSNIEYVLEKYCSAVQADASTPVDVYDVAISSEEEQAGGKVLYTIHYKLRTGEPGQENVTEHDATVKKLNGSQFNVIDGGI